MLQCGRCGALSHARCHPGRYPPCYWYCPGCEDEIARQGGPQDVTEDVQLLRFLLGGPRPRHYTAEAADELSWHYAVRRGQLLVECQNGYRVFPCSYDRHHLIEDFHRQLMHSGARGTLEALREYYYWPSMEADVRAYCATCLSCQLENAVFRRAEVLGGHLTAAAPRVAWSLDCAPAIKTAEGSRSSILIAVDDFTRYTLCIEIPRLDSNAVKKAFVERIVGPYGRPQRVRTDQGREFEGVFANFL